LESNHEHPGCEQRKEEALPVTGRTNIKPEEPRKEKYRDNAAREDE